MMVDAATRLRNMRTSMSLDKREAEKTWALLRNAINEIFNSNEGHLSFEELYRSAYNLVLYKYGDMLYKGVYEEVTYNMKKVGQELASKSDDALLMELVIKWEYFVLRMNMVKDILMYMDRTYVATKGVYPVYDMGLKVFREEVSRNKKIKDRLLTMLLNNIAKERSGGIINREVMRKLLFMHVELGVSSREVYITDFEEHFLADTERFYSLEGAKNIQNDSVAEYLLKVEIRLEQEKNRARHYLDDSSYNKLMTLVERELIEKHHKTLVHSKTGCFFMYENGKIDDIKRMFNLFSRVPVTLNEMRNEFIRYVKEDGESLVNKDESDKFAIKFVRHLLSQRAHYEDIVDVACQKDKQFKKALKDAFEHVVNLNRKVAHFLSLYVDDMMKDKAKKKGEFETDDDKTLDEHLNKVITVFNHLHDRDIFEDFYKQLLAKRLLTKKKNFNTDYSAVAEEMMISKLKAECGPQFTTKLENMIRDMKLSEDDTADFRTQMIATRGNAAAAVGSELAENFEVTVLTTGSWPYNAGNTMCNIPETLKTNLIDEFEAHYKSKHEGRELKWVHSLGNVEMRSRFMGTDGIPKTYTLIISTYQMMILLLFNEKEQLTFEEILTQTNIPEIELKRHIISLAAPRYKILNKEPKSKLIEKDDVFAINESFSSNLNRVRVPLISARSTLNNRLMQGQTTGSDGTEVKADGTSGEGDDISPQVQEDRKHLLEAAIVRVMKSRKTLANNILVAEVLKQVSVRFQPSPQDIKQRIEGLIERDYMERDETDRRIYHYLA